MEQKHQRSKSDKYIPIRTCIACRAKKPKTDLIRLNETQGVKGRYACDDPKCLEKASRIIKR